ncbi:hypothetical protein N7474_000328 [Penicillium riverlandense]|uniref:uncharacterized protein n=1 Tax=Penicillium riverlandense TaxID=1903569 RepID=UPI0025480881|nr:uncharacterized protein N7474_000328 [Penicillium riverlandense]KAJ5832017.1 hypothetical protein N7474_000328 [Penicillium riverlandense]
MCSIYTQDLIEKSNLRVILLCGQMAEDVVLTDDDQTRALSLNIRGLDFRLWIRPKDNAIERLFVRSPAPLVELWSCKGQAAQRINALFQFVAAVTNAKLFPAFFESALTVELIVRGWDDERAKRIEPLTPQLDMINPILRIWLEKLGFTKDDDIQRLAECCKDTECCAGSLRYGLLVLSKVLPRRQRLGTGRIPPSHTRRRGVIGAKALDMVRSLLSDVQRQDYSLSSKATPPHTNASHPGSLPEGIDSVDDSAVLEAIHCGSAIIEEFNPEEEQNVLIGRRFEDSQTLRKRREVDTMAFRKHLRLLTGYSYKGNETKKGSDSSYQFQRPSFGERHPNSYTLEGTEDDPGIRFALRITLLGEDGEEYFTQYAKSSSWQAIAIANSFVDGLSGDTLEEICRRRRRFGFIDKRLQNIPPELKLFVNGAYRYDDGTIVTFKGHSRKTIGGSC